MANEDVVDFGPGSELGRSHRRFNVPWRDPRLAIAAAVIGAATGVVSLMGDWYSSAIPDDKGPRDKTFIIVGSLSTTGMLGATYLLLLAAQISVVAIVLFGRGQARHNARLAGLGLSGAAAVLLVYIVSNMKVMIHVDIAFLRYGLPSEIAEKVSIEVGQGLWAAFAAVVLLGLSFLLTAPEPAEPAPAVVEELAAEEEPDHPTDDPMQLTVSNEIPRARPSEDELEMYRRPR